MRNRWTAGLRSTRSCLHWELDRIHQSLWLAADGTSLFTGTTVIFTTHALAMAWSATHMTRVWHHPQFRRQDGRQSHEELTGELRFEKVVFDEPRMGRITSTFFPKTCTHICQCKVVGTGKGWLRKAGREQFQAMKVLLERPLRTSKWWQPDQSGGYVMTVKVGSKRIEFEGQIGDRCRFVGEAAQRDRCANQGR